MADRTDAPSESRQRETRQPRQARGTGAPRRKATRLEARLTDGQKVLLQEAAALRGQTLTEFVVRAGEDAATRVLEGAGVVVLTGADSAAFVDAVLAPPEPPEPLRAAAARYRQHRQEHQPPKHRDETDVPQRSAAE